MKTITDEEENNIIKLLSRMHLTSGLGTKEEACSIACINIALTGELTDDIPECMSLVLGKWIIWIQDRMPDEMRNSESWKRLLPFAAGTGRENEKEKLKIIIDWMWRTLELLQPLASEKGFGEAWLKMTIEKSSAAAGAAAGAAARAADACAAARAAGAAARAAADAAADAADAARAADAAADAGAAAGAAARAADASFWNQVNPVELLEKLIK